MLEVIDGGALTAPALPWAGRRDAAAPGGRDRRLGRRRRRWGCLRRLRPEARRARSAPSRAGIDREERFGIDEQAPPRALQCRWARACPRRADGADLCPLPDLLAWRTSIRSGGSRG